MSLGWLVVSNAGVVSNTIEDVVSLFGENPPWQGDQWAVFEDGFRVNFAIVFVIVLLSFCVT